MKKHLTPATLAALTLAVCLHAQYGYDGPMDEIWWARYGEKFYGLFVANTTLANLARYSDGKLGEIGGWLLTFNIS